MMIAMLSSEVVALLINGPLKKLYGSAVSVMIISCVSCLLSAVIACFVKIPPPDNSKSIKVTDKHETEGVVNKTVTESTKLLHN